MNIQVDIPLELNKWLKIQKVLRDKITLADTIVEILEEKQKQSEI